MFKPQSQYTYPLMFVVCLQLACAEQPTPTQTPTPRADMMGADLGGADQGDVSDSDAPDQPNPQDMAPHPEDMAQDQGSAPQPAYEAVGAPPRLASGQGLRPVVLWPRPSYAHPEMPFSFTMVAYDPEHEQLSYALEGAPAGMSVDAYGRISWPSPAARGTFELVVLVDDGRQDPERVPLKITVDASQFLFVSPGGDDQAAGTLSAPRRDIELAMREQAKPDGPRHLVLRQGEYKIAWSWESNGNPSPTRTFKGTQASPFVIMGYPGELAILDAQEQGHGLWSYNASYVIFRELEVRGARAGERGGVILDGDHVLAQEVTVRDSNWPTSQNCTGFLLRGDQSVCHRCRGINNYDRQNEHWNSSNYLTYPEGGQQQIYILDSYSEGSFVGFKIKHAGDGQVLFHGNRDKGSKIGFGGIDDGSVVSHNLFEDNTGSALGLAITDPNSYTTGGFIAHHNTALRAKHGFWIGDSYGQEGVELAHNLFYSEAELGARENEPLMAFVWPYRMEVDPSKLNIHHNCYSAPNDDQGFWLGSVHRGAYSRWQAQGLDKESVWGDAGFEPGEFKTSPASPCATVDAGASGSR